MELLLPGEDAQWDYAVLATDSAYPLKSMAQLYRDRADAQNGFAELKKQWGWGGFTTHDIERCQTSARAVALVYNWWSWYCRASKPDARMEAIASRGLLLASVGRATRHAGQRFHPQRIAISERKKRKLLPHTGLPYRSSGLTAKKGNEGNSIMEVSPFGSQKKNSPIGFTRFSPCAYGASS